MKTVRSARSMIVALLAALTCAAAAQADIAVPRVPDEFLDRVRRLEGDSIRVCVNAESLLADFERDLAAEIGLALLVEVTVIDITGLRAPPILDYSLSLNERELFLLLNNTCHMLSGFLLSTSRFADWLTPTRPYAEFGFVFSSLEPLSSLGDLPPGARIGTKMGTTADLAFSEYVRTLPESRRWRRIPYVNNQLLIDRLAEGDLDAILVWEPALVSATDGDPEAFGIRRLRSEPMRLASQRFGIVMLARDGFLRVAVDSAIEVLTADGTVTELISRHGLPGRPASSD